MVVLWLLLLIDIHARRAAVLSATVSDFDQTCCSTVGLKRQPDFAHPC